MTSSATAGSSLNSAFSREALSRAGGSASFEHLVRASEVPCRVLELLMTRAFISYRREDTAASAGRLYETLRGAVGAERLYKDVDNVPLGSDFRREIADAIADSSAVIAVIGPNWLGLPVDGEARIRHANDFVRIELAQALASELDVIPVLVDGATMPDPGELPEELADLVYLNAAKLDHDSWDRDVEPLVAAVAALVARTDRHESVESDESGSKPADHERDSDTTIPTKIEIGKTYTGRVVNITKFGAFVNIIPGRDGLVHISQLGGGQRVKSVNDVLALGQEIRVKVLDVDAHGKVSLIPVSEVAGTWRAVRRTPRLLVTEQVTLSKGGRETRLKITPDELKIADKVCWTQPSPASFNAEVWGQKHHFLVQWRSRDDWTGYIDVVSLEIDGRQVEIEGIRTQP